MNQTTILIGAEELTSLASFAITLSNLLMKIQAEQPDAWAQVTSDFNTSLQGWQVSAPQLPTAAPGQPAVLKPIDPELVTYYGASLTTVQRPPVESETAAQLTGPTPVATADAAALPLGQHIQAAPTQVP